MGEHKEFHKITKLITLNKNGWGSKSHINSKFKGKYHVYKSSSNIEFILTKIALVQQDLFIGQVPDVTRDWNFTKKLSN